VRVVWKHHPLDFHQDAPLAHMASAAAGNQGKFWEYHDKIFANQSKIKRDDLVKYAQDLQLDMARFEKDLNDLDLKKLIDADKAEAVSLGATGTPAFFVNGRYLSGAKPFEEFAKVINEELKKKNIPVPAEAQGS
jgi:protein-disulfide isomerase